MDTAEPEGRHLHDTAHEGQRLRLVIHDDQVTPRDYVIALLRATLDLSDSDAAAVAAAVEAQGRAICGTYPAPVAEAVLRAAQQHARRHGYPLRLALEPGPADAAGACGCCGGRIQPGEVAYTGGASAICPRCLLAGAAHLATAFRDQTFKHAHEAIAWHFAATPKDRLATTSRQFPGHMRADVQAAVDALFAAPAIRFFGIDEQHRYETMTFATLTRDSQHAPAIAPAQYRDVDIGEDVPARCLDNGLWLCAAGELRYAVVLSFHREYGQEAGLRVEIAVPLGEAGADLVRRCFLQLEAAIDAARSYRGKVLSLEDAGDYRGRSHGIMVHRLAPVARADVILPEATLALLDRNVLGFVGSRHRLRELGQHTRKGILLYGPPGTGKTHTIRYLASSLPGHTTLIITAGQVALLGQYMSLARLLQPAMVVIEDVDLIARDRESMGGPCEESLLNKLLNEMDGLKQDADILFVLTTNRPGQLEEALSGRPGRIDQAIEVALPDADGRRRLVALYGKALALDAAVVADAVRRTEGVSAAFIKELMRRTAQASIKRGGATVSTGDIGEALDDMLFTGGSLNVKLLGGAPARPAGAGR